MKQEATITEKCQVTIPKIIQNIQEINTEII